MAASRAGGGTAVVPPGRYLCFSIRLQNDVTIALTAGAVIEAADPDRHGGRYDAPETYLEEQFQDFGITPVHKRLTYGDGVSNAPVVGRGRLAGRGRAAGGPAPHRARGSGGQGAQ